MNIFKNFSLFIFIIFSFQNIQTSFLKRSPRLLMTFSPTQVGKFIPWLTEHQKNTKDYLQALPSEEQEIATTAVNPEILFSYLILCQRFEISPLPVLSYPHKQCPDRPIFIQTANSKQNVGIVTSFKDFPKSLQHLKLLQAAYASRQPINFTLNTNTLAIKNAIQNISCPVCLKIQETLNKDNAYESFFRSQIHKAVHLCPAHATYNTDNLEQNVYQLSQIKKIKTFQHLTKEEWQVVFQIVNEDNSMGSIFDRIPPNLLPENFV